MKKMPLIIAVPLIAIIVVVAASMVLRMRVNTPPNVSVVNTTEFPNALNDSSQSAPSTFLGGLFGQVTVTPTPTPSTATDLSRELKDTYDDGGQAELDALTKDAASL